MSFALNDLSFDSVALPLIIKELALVFSSRECHGGGKWFDSHESSKSDQHR